MKQMVRSQSDNFTRFEAKFFTKSQILYPSPQKRNISFEFKLKNANHVNEKPHSPDSSSKISSLNSIDEFEIRSPLKMTKSVSTMTMEKMSSFNYHRKETEGERNFEEYRNLRKESMNPHEKNFVEHSATQSNIKAKEINEEAQDEEEEYENREEMCDFDKFLNDMEDK